MDLSFHKEALINRAPRVQLLIVRGIIYIYRQYIYIYSTYYICCQCLQVPSKVSLSDPFWTRSQFERDEVREITEWTNNR